METGELQEGGTVKRKDLRDIYGKIARPDVIGDLGSVTMADGGIFGVLGTKGKFSNTKLVGEQAKPEAGDTGEEVEKKVKKFSAASRGSSDLGPKAAEAAHIGVYVGSKLKKEILVTVAKVDGQVVGGAMTLEQWRAMRDTRPVYMCLYACVCV